MVLDTAKVTSKGQVTIPSEIRKRFGIEEGSRILFEETPDGELRVRRLDAKDKLSAYKDLQAIISDQVEEEGMTEEEVLALVKRVRREIQDERRTRAGG